MADRTLTMLVVGDLILNKPQAESFFALSAPVLRSADVVVGQVEVPFTSRGIETHVEIIPNAPCDPRNMSALPYAGFNVVTLAGNHIWDSGTPGIEDTIIGLRKYGITVVGAGMNINEARSPAVIERNGTRIGFLNYNCIGPKQTWATPGKPGCAYVNIISHYELPIANPGGPPTIYTYADPQSLEAMVEDIRKVRPHCEVLVVVFHKGVILTPAKIAMYERQVSHTAIDAGADLVLGHHAHILRGIEKYKGKSIFHGIGHFVVAMQSLTVNGTGAAVDIQQVRKRLEELFGFEFGSDEDSKGLFPSDSKKTIIAKCIIDDGRISRTSYLPCLINKEGQPEILKNDDRGRQVFDYMDKITQKAGLNARYEWEGDEVVIHAEQAYVGSAERR